MTNTLTSLLPKINLGKFAKQIAFATILAASPSLAQAENLVNNAVPAIMSAGNSTYTLNNGFSKTFTGYEMSVGQYWSTNNSFSIIEGASASIHNAPFYVGILADSNSVTVSGAGSKWESTFTSWGDSSIFMVGFGGNSNSLTVNNGGIVKGSHFVVGAGNSEEGAQANGNTITVSGANSSLEGTNTFRVGSSIANNNHLNVNDGASLKSFHLYIGEQGINNTATITGSGSTWENQMTIQIGNWDSTNSSLTISDGAKATSGFGAANAKTYIGRLGSDSSSLVISGEQSSLALRSDLAVGDASSTNSVLRIEDGGLLKLGDSTTAGTLSIGADVNTVVRIDDGYFAWYGDQVSALEGHILGGKFQIWDEDTSNWIAGSLDNLFITYINLGTGEAETNGLYNDLNGYTVVTTIPEPSTWALVALSAAGLAFARSRRRM